MIDIDNDKDDSLPVADQTEERLQRQNGVNKKLKGANKDLLNKLIHVQNQLAERTGQLAEAEAEAAHNRKMFLKGLNGINELVNVRLDQLMSQTRDIQSNLGL